MSIAHNQATRIPPRTLGIRLRDAREYAGLDQNALADALDVGRATISNYERGVTKPNRLQINAWAVTCDVDVEWLKTGRASRGDGPDGDGSAKQEYRISGVLTHIYAHSTHRAA